MDKQQRRYDKAIDLIRGFSPVATKQEIQDTVIRVVAKQIDLAPEKIKPESQIAVDLGADSLDLAEIMMDLEDEFDLMVQDDDAGKIKTVADAVAFIEKEISKR